METVTDFIFLGSKITVDGDCSHEIKRHLLLGRKAITNRGGGGGGGLVAKSCPTLATPWTIALQAPLSSTISWSLLRFLSIESVMLSSH